MNRVVVVLLAVVLALAVAPTAMSANGPTQAGYGGEAAVQVTLVESRGPAAASTQAVTAQRLPLTGAEIGVLFAAGAILLVVGLGMRRLARERE